MLKDYFQLAYRSAKQRKLRSSLTMLGIFIGIAAVVGLVSLSQGLQSAIAEQFVSLGSDKVIVQGISSGFGPPGTGVESPLTKDDLEVIEKVSGVDNAVGRLIRSVKTEFNDKIIYSYLVSMPEDNEDIFLAIEANNYKIGSGRLLDKNDKFKVLLGKDILDNYGSKDIEIRDTLIINDIPFSVVGILKKSGNPQQDSSIIIPEQSLREVLGLENIYDLIPVKITAGENIDLAVERMKKELRKHRNVEEGKEDFTIETPENILATLNTILMIVQGVLVGIAAISLFVGGIGIMNTMYTAVVERTKEIGIMKATGARRRQILLLFLVESGMLGLFGGLIGVSIGYGMSKLVEYIAFQIFESYLIRADFNLLLLVGMLIFAFVIGALSGVFPARQAAMLKPVDALRK